MRRIVFVSALCLMSLVATAAEAPGPALVDVYKDLNAMCRGGIGDNTDQACDIRQKVSGVLKTVGYCFGKRGQSGGEMWWHRCGPDSLH